MNLGERLKQVRDDLGYTQKEMAKAINTNPQTWQVYESGKSVPGGNVLEALARMGFNVNWLLTGEGEKKREASCSWWAERMLEIRGTLTIPEFARKVHFSDPEKGIAEIQAIEAGKMDASWQLMTLFSQELGIDPAWMVDGGGPMLKKDVALAAVKLPEMPNSLQLLTIIATAFEVFCSVDTDLAKDYARSILSLYSAGLKKDATGDIDLDDLRKFLTILSDVYKSRAAQGN